MNGLPRLDYLINLGSKFTLASVNMGTFGFLHDSIRRLISILRVKCLLRAAIFTNLFCCSLVACLEDLLLRSHHIGGILALILLLLLLALKLIELLPAFVLESSTLGARRYSKRALPQSCLLTAKVELEPLFAQLA